MKKAMLLLSILSFTFAQDSLEEVLKLCQGQARIRWH